MCVSLAQLRIYLPSRSCCLAPLLWDVLAGGLEPLGLEHVHAGHAQDGQRAPCHPGEEHHFGGREERMYGSLQA